MGEVETVLFIQRIKNGTIELVKKQKTKKKNILEAYLLKK